MPSSFSYEFASSIRSINLVEHAAVCKMCFLRLLPIASNFRQRKQPHLGELAGIFLGNCLGARPVITLGGDFLAFRTVEVLEIRLCYSACSLLVHDLVHDADCGLA